MATPASHCSLRDRIVLVTGASRGLGRAMAGALMERGARVIAASRHPDPDGPGVKLPVDVRDPASVAGLFDQIRERFGRLDVLVNNAGLMVGDRDLAEVDPALWDTVLATNLHGAYYCARQALELMPEGGAIVNISSGAAVRTGFLNIAYGVSKAGLDRLTLGLADALRPRNIACLSLSPPVSATDTVRAMYPDRNVDSFARPPAWTALTLCTLLENHPMQHSGEVVLVRQYLVSRGLLNE